jgi:hypothetical protein
MPRTMTRSRHALYVLLPLLLIIALVQVLPQVDLPATAFHENEAPIVAKFRLVQAPVIVAAPGAAAALRAVLRYEAASELSASYDTPSPASSLPVLLASLLC